MLNNLVVMRTLLNNRTADVLDYARAVRQLLANSGTAAAPNLRALEVAKVLANA